MATKNTKHGVGKGVGGGREKLYTREWCDNEAEALLQWIKLPTSIYFKTFCYERGYGAQRVAEFAETSTKFAEALSVAHQWQEQKLMVGGLTSTFNPTITKLALTKYGYNDREKESAKDSAIDALANLLLQSAGKSKSLVNDTESND